MKRSRPIFRYNEYHLDSVGGSKIPRTTDTTPATDRNSSLGQVRRLDYLNSRNSFSSRFTVAPTSERKVLPAPLKHEQSVYHSYRDAARNLSPDGRLRRFVFSQPGHVDTVSNTEVSLDTVCVVFVSTGRGNCVVRNDYCAGAMNSYERCSEIDDCGSTCVGISGGG